VRIPPGATDGRRIRVPAHGEPAAAAARRATFTCGCGMRPIRNSTPRGGRLSRAAGRALGGGARAEIAVPTLDGTIKLRVPAGTENGKQLRVRGRGLPKGKTGERGDFYVIVEVALPTKLSDEERANGKSFAASRISTPSTPSP